MPPPYSKIPTLSEWLLDLETSVGGPPETDYIIEIISNLIKTYNDYKADEQRRSRQHHHILVLYLYQAAAFWKKNRNKPVKQRHDLPHKKYFTSNEKFIEPISALKNICEIKLRKYMFIDEINASLDMDKEIVDFYGCPNQNAELELLCIDKLLYFQNDVDRIRYKIHIRYGRLYRSRSLGESDDVIYEEYDSERSGESEKGDGWVHYVMDFRGKLYVGYRNDIHQKNFYHSSLTGGETVFSAGTMYIKNGLITGISDESGHYQPGAKHIAIVLQLLIFKNVDISQIKIKKHGNPAFIPASFILSERRWPLQAEMETF